MIVACASNGQYQHQNHLDQHLTRSKNVVSTQILYHYYAGCWVPDHHQQAVHYHFIRVSNSNTERLRCTYLVVGTMTEHVASCHNIPSPCLFVGRPRRLMAFTPLKIRLPLRSATEPPSSTASRRLGLSWLLNMDRDLHPLMTILIARLITWRRCIFKVHMGVGVIVGIIVGSRMMYAVLLSLQRFDTFVEHLLEGDGVSGVGAEESVCHIAEEGYKTNGKVDRDVHDHGRAQLVAIFPGRHLHGSIHDHEGHENIDEVAKGRDKAYDGAPAELQAAKANGLVESVCTAFDLGEDFGVGFGDFGVDAALNLLGLAIILGTAV